MVRGRHVVGGSRLGVGGSSAARLLRLEARLGGLELTHLRLQRRLGRLAAAAARRLAAAAAAASETARLELALQRAQPSAQSLQRAVLGPSRRVGREVQHLVPRSGRRRATERLVVHQHARVVVPPPRRPAAAFERGGFQLCAARLARREQCLEAGAPLRRRSLRPLGVRRLLLRSALRRLRRARHRLELRRLGLELGSRRLAQPLPLLQRRHPAGRRRHRS